MTSVLDHSNSAHNELLNKIKRRLRNETFTPDYLREIITLYPELIRALYLSFASYHYVHTREGENGFAPSFGSSSSTAPSVLKDHELQQLINKTVVNSDHENVMTACRMFNNSGNRPLPQSTLDANHIHSLENELLHTNQGCAFISPRCQLPADRRVPTSGL